MSWFVLIVFGLMPCTAALFALRTLGLLRQGVRFTGTIIDYEVRSSSNFAEHRNIHIPVVSFSSASGKRYTVTMFMSATPLELNQRQPVKLIYRKGRPQAAAQNEALRSLCFFPIWLCAPAFTIMVFFGLLLLWFRYAG